MGYEDRRSKYYYEDDDVLINKMDIKDIKLLDEYERRVVSLKLLIIEHANFSKNFDKNMLCEMHKFLFGEVYDFAGEYREENLAKDDFRFASCEFIESELDRVLSPLSNISDYQGKSKRDMAKILADIMSEINVIHPFREGNGRTYREFIREFAKACLWKLDWGKCPYEDIYNASLKSVYDTDELCVVIYKCLSEMKDKDDNDSKSKSENDGKTKNKKIKNISTKNEIINGEKVTKEKLSKVVNDDEKKREFKEKKMMSSDKIKIVSFDDEKTSAKNRLKREKAKANEKEKDKLKKSKFKLIK